MPAGMLLEPNRLRGRDTEPARPRTKRRRRSHPNVEAEQLSLLR
jgi:hypothetical protein